MIVHEGLFEESRFMVKLGVVLIIISTVIFVGLMLVPDTLVPLAPLF